MPKPIVAIVGRPNVGKSTLFNRIVGQRIAIVDDAPGITRDRLYADTDWLSHDFTLVDTGGLDPDGDDMAKHVFSQATAAIEVADVIIFLADIKSGVLEHDQDVARLLRRANKPVVLAVNKVDNPRAPHDEMYEFYELGLGEPIPISAGQALGLGDMLDVVVSHFPASVESSDTPTTIKVAIVGRPNVGKSSLINKILGAERLIVSETPGTTRDAIDTPIVRDGQNYVLIDTAGLRRKSKIKENVERYSVLRTIAALERCDVCCLMVDALLGISEQDVKIAGLAHERGRAAVVAVNKWDAIEKSDKTMREFEVKIARELSYMPYAPQVYVSAKSGQRVGRLFELFYTCFQNHSMRVSTGQLNEIIIDAVATHPPPTDKGRALRIYYATQVSVGPPTFVLFVNDKRLMHFSYIRYLENKLRETFGFSGTPIRFIVREKQRD